MGGSHGALRRRPELAGDFLEAVGEDIAPGYAAAAPLPTHLSLILGRLLHGHYRSWLALREDARRIASNCAAYNEAGSDIVERAQRA